MHCVPPWRVGPCRRISRAALKEAVPVRGRPAPITWSLVPGTGEGGACPISIEGRNGDSLVGQSRGPGEACFTT